MDGIYFFKGKQNVLEDKSTNEEVSFKIIQDAFGKILDGKNLSFLLGCGTSSHYESDKEVGIPTMVPLATEFYKSILSEKDKKYFKTELNVDVDNSTFSKNIEKLLGTLHSIGYFFETTNQTTSEQFKNVDALIKSIRNFLIEKCLNTSNRLPGAKGEPSTDKSLLDIYTTFYRKLLFRNSNLPKVNIFTTNYDLYNETALDLLGIYYVNGFAGGVSKYFNPTMFNYALAEKMDLSQTKWSVIDNFIYLYKLHGSVNWIQDNHDLKLFKVREIHDCTLDELTAKEVVMIHPTPLKYNASLGSPYSDLFREFQRKLMQPNNVLITLGYSFSDEHINNLIYQAFTIPSFRLIILGDLSENKVFKDLQEINDPRIWIIGGKMDNSENLHYFKGFTNHVLPDLSNDDLDQKLENTFIELLKKMNREQGG